MHPSNRLVLSSSGFQFISHFISIPISSLLVVVSGGLLISISISTIGGSGLWLRLSGIRQLLHVVHLGNVLVATHVDVEEVPLSEDVHAELQKEVLGEASLHLHAVIVLHVTVGHDAREAAGLLAVLDGLAEPVGKGVLSNDLLASVSLRHLHLDWIASF